MNITVRNLKLKKSLTATSYKVAVYLVLLSLFSLFYLPTNSQAQTTPTLNATFGVRDENAITFYNTQVSYPAGHRLRFRIVVSNDQNSTIATNTRVKVDLPKGSFINSQAKLVVFSSNSGLYSSQIILNPTSTAGSILNYVAGSTRVTWDVNGDGKREFNYSQWEDGINSDSGVLLGELIGCQHCKADITFLVDTNQGSSAAGAAPNPQPTAIIAQSTTTNTQTTTSTSGTVASATSSASNLPKTGTASLILAMLVLTAGTLIGLRLRLFGDLAIKRYALPYALKSYQGKNLNPNDVILNRKIVKTIIQK